MSITVKEVSNGSNMRWGDEGWEDTRVFFVSGLEGTTSKKRYDAATATGIPQRGQAHPHINGIVARTCPGIEMPKGHEHARVTINYAVPEEGESGGGGGGGEDTTTSINGISIRLGSVYERVRSDVEIKPNGEKGKAIKVWSNPLAPIGSGASSGWKPETLTPTNYQVASVGILMPRPTIILSGKSKNIPLSRSLKVGRTNIDDWITALAAKFDAIPPEMTEVDSWLLMRQSAQSTDGGATVSIEREIAFRADKWLEVAVFIDPATGRPPANAGVPDPIFAGAEGVGFRVVRVAGQASFKDLLEF